MVNALFSLWSDVRLWRYSWVFLIFSGLAFGSEPPTGNTTAYYHTQQFANPAFNTCYGESKRCTFSQINDINIQACNAAFADTCTFQRSAFFSETRELFYYKRTGYPSEFAYGGYIGIVNDFFPPECPLNYTYNSGTGLCDPPPNNCVAGSTKTLTEFQPNGGTVVYIGGGGPDLSDGECRYTCSSSGSDGSFFYDDTGTYRDYLCTATGDLAQESDVESASVPVDAKSSEGSTKNGQTCSTVGGTTVCVGGDLPENCMTVNGVKTCQSEAAADEAVIDDTPVSKSDSKNCVKSTNGEIICVADQSESEFCGTVNGVKTCYSRSGAKETTTTTEETLGDGTVVVTKETGSNVRNNVNDGRIIETTAPDGSVTTVREGGDQGALQDIAKAAGKAECDKPGMAGTVACMDADEFKGEAGTPGPSGEGAESGRWYTATDKTFQSVLESSMTQLQSQPIMQFGNDLFAVTIPAGSCPSWVIDGSAVGIAPVTVAPLCSDMMENFWPMISGVVQVLAVFMAFYIAMRGL